jgi:hypothetical protein
VQRSCLLVDSTLSGPPLARLYEEFQESLVLFRDFVAFSMACSWRGEAPVLGPASLVNSTDLELRFAEEKDEQAQAKEVAATGAQQVAKQQVAGVSPKDTSCPL